MNADKELITENPFAILVRRINRIEYQNEQILSFLQSKAQSPSSIAVSSTSKKIDFPTVMKEYFPGIPESTVRQVTAGFSRTKVGRRILFDRDEVEQKQEERRRKSAKVLSQEANQQFSNQHRRRGGRKTA